MTTENYITQCPVIRRETASLVARVNINGKVVYVPTVEELLWIRESSAQISMWHGDVKIKENIQTSDYYGFLKSVSGALEDVEGILQTYKITPESTLEVRVHVTIEDTPYLEDQTYKGKEWNEWNKKSLSYQMLDKEQLWYYNVPEEVSKMAQIFNTPYIEDANNEEAFRARLDACDNFEKLEITKKEVVKDLLIWSSKQGALMTVEDLQKQYTVV